MALNTSAFAKEDQCAFFLRRCHGFAVSSRETVNRRVRKDQSEFELRNGPAEHREVDRTPSRHRWEEVAEQRLVCGCRVQTGKNRLANRLISESAGVRRRHRRSQSIIELVECRPNRASRASKTSDLDQFRRRYVRLRDQQMRNNGV